MEIMEDYNRFVNKQKNKKQEKWDVVFFCNLRSILFFRGE